MQYGIAFSPLIPLPALWIAAAVIGVLALILLFGRSRGAALRVAAMALIWLALANPSFTREEREPLASVAAVVIDRSPSQNFGERTREADAANEALVERLKAIKGLEVRTVEAAHADGETDGTKLFGALATTLSDVPADRIAGAFLITDGRVHDIPANAEALGFSAPLHALITGHSRERDRRVAILAAPRFGIVGQPQTISYRLDDQGVSGERAEVTVRRDGEELSKRSVASGERVEITVDIPHAGPNIVEIEASPLEGELTRVNNRAVVSIDGVRDKLRVLLVSGEPHAGERTWRNLLKSDPSVDLVHFTILRPPEKQDGTPINELSLIAFPTRELFQQKINEFQLIILDRYSRQGVLPIAYFDNIARYVRRGGAVLISAGPDYASATSIWRTPLDSVLPAEPAGVTEKAFVARVSETGKRHPVTRGLAGADFDPPHWSRFFRLIDTRNVATPPVMEGDGKPLLVLSRFGEGRVALLLSDQIWLWARGFEGGGPHLDLLRRTSHWLMKQPDLEEEALRLEASGRTLVASRQTMGETASPITVTSPSGATRELTPKPAEPGLWRAATPADELGLWSATDGTLKALINIGPTNPKEFSEVTSTTETLRPLAHATGGDVRRIAEAGGGAIEVPRIAPVHSARGFHGDGWLGVRMREASVARGIGVLPMFAGAIGLLLLIGALGATWLREGR
jgi:hypothetical protein